MDKVHLIGLRLMVFVIFELFAFRRYIFFKIPDEKITTKFPRLQNPERVRQKGYPDQRMNASKFQ